MSKCLRCYKELNKGEESYHSKCLKDFFAEGQIPKISYTLDEIKSMGEVLVADRISVTGVQPKLSIDFQKTGKDNKITIVGFKGNYILKIPVEKYPHLPEFEDVTMHLARVVNINTVKHCLIKMQDENLAYITKRIDRTAKGKVQMEDMCQISGKLTENKYRGSYEQIAKKIAGHSTAAGLDVLNFAEVILFCFITGNSDMHLKNFSLLEINENNIRLSPAYDLVPSSILVEKDTEETALTLNGKKRNITLNDFKNFFESISINEKVVDTTFNKFAKSFRIFSEVIESCFLPDKFKEQYIALIEERMIRLKIF